MRTRVIASIELVLISPAAFFMTALMLRQLQPLQYEPARSAHQLIMWYAGRMWTLWILLLGLPCIVLVSGCAELLRSWNGDNALPLACLKSPAACRAHLAMLFITVTTLFAALILVIVVLHVLSN